MARQKKTKPAKELVKENSALDLLNSSKQEYITETSFIDEAIQPDIKKAETRVLKNIDASSKENSHIDISIDYVYITFPCGSPFFLEKSYLSKNKLFYPDLINITASTLGSSKAKYNLAKLVALKKYASLTKASYVCFIDKNFKLKEYIDFKNILKEQNKIEMILIGDQCFLVKCDKIKKFDIDINKTLTENIKILSSKLNTIGVEY